MNKTKAIFIINPVSNHGESIKTLPYIKSIFQDRFDCHYVQTSKPKDAIDLAKNIETYDIVVAVGGDGTAHEVVNGLALSNNKKTAMGVIPTGSGNDYSYTLGLSRNVKKACQQLIKTQIKEIDLGVVNGVYFANSIGIGFDARVAFLANQIKNEVKKSGLILYLTALLRIVRNDYYWHKVTFQIDNGDWQEKEALLLAITIGKTYGGGFKITPQAISDDGLLDFCIIDPIPRNQVLARLPFVVVGHHHWMRQEHHSLIKKINIQSEVEIPAQLDGELMLSANYSIEIIPKGLRVLTGN